MVREIKWLKWIYLFLAILGAVLPTLANIEFAKSYGPAFDIQLFIELANNNPASQFKIINLLSKRRTIESPRASKLLILGASCRLWRRF